MRITRFILEPYTVLAVKKYFFLFVFVVAGAIFLAHAQGVAAYDKSYLLSYPAATRERVDAAYTDAAVPPPGDERARAAIVNHHLLAPALIARVMRRLELQKIKTIILVSPDHFSAGKKKISTTALPWRTPYGDMEAEKSLIDGLIRAGLANNDDAPFANEHGISGIMPFIKKSFPDSTVVPIIIKDSARDHEIDALADFLGRTDSDDTVVIGSFDFSHYLPLQLADFHDRKSMEVLRLRDYEGMKVLDIDSRPGLRLVEKFADHVAARSFQLFDNENSVRITGKNNSTDTTSYITGVFTEAEPQKQETVVTIFAVGDIMLDRGVRAAMEKRGLGYPFKKMERALAGSDVLVGNLEGPITDSTPKKNANTMTFTFSPSVVPTLKRLGFSLFSIANNHTLNFGVKGLAQTKKYLTKDGIAYFGNPKNRQDISRVIEIRGMRIGFVGFHGLVRDGNARVIDEIKKIRPTVDALIVYPHWGSEYEPQFSERQQNDAHAFIDAGADIIIGSHPHVVQPMEVYRDKPIFYSLGNFIFDQTFSKETQQGLALGIAIAKDRFTVTLVPVQSAFLQASIMEQKLKSAFLGWFAKKSSVPHELKYQIKNGFIEIIRN